MTELNIPDGTNYQYYQCFVNSFNNIICNKIDNKYTYINGCRLTKVHNFTLLVGYCKKYFIKY